MNYETDNNFEYEHGTADEGTTEIVPSEPKQPVPKKKKRRKKRYFLKFCIFVAACVGVYFFLHSSVFSAEKIVLAENVATGQQIEKFSLYYYYDKRWHKIYKGTTIGRKKICIIAPMEARRIKLVIEKTREFATISEFKVY